MQVEPSTRPEPAASTAEGFWKGLLLLPWAVWDGTTSCVRFTWSVLVSAVRAVWSTLVAIARGFWLAVSTVAKVVWALLWGSVRAILRVIGWAVEAVGSVLRSSARGVWTGMNHLGWGIWSLVHIPTAAIQDAFVKARIWGGLGALGSSVHLLVEDRNRAVLAALVLLNLAALAVWLRLPAALVAVVKGVTAASVRASYRAFKLAVSGARATWKLISSMLPDIFWVSLCRCLLRILSGTVIIGGQVIIGGAADDYLAKYCSQQYVVLLLITNEM